MAWLKRYGGIWFIYWREGGRGSPERSVRVGPKKTDAQRAKVEIEARLLAGKLGGGVLPKRTTFVDFARDWLDKRTVRDTTLRRDRGIVKEHLLPEFGPRLLQGIEREEIHSLIVRVNREVSPYTARRTLATLRRMLEDAREWNYLRENPAWRLKAPPLPHKEHAVLSVQEVCSLLGALPAHWRPFTLSFALAGLRVGEARALKWPDLNFDANKLHVRRQRAAGTQIERAPKSFSSARTVDLLPPLRSVLMDLPQRSDLVFPAARGGPIAYEWYMKAVWWPTIERLGLNASPHDLRHFYGSLLLAFGEPIIYICQQMGHSSPSVTHNVYLHLIREGRHLDREATLARISLACGEGAVKSSQRAPETTGVKA